MIYGEVTNLAALGMVCDDIKETEQLCNDLYVTRDALIRLLIGQQVPVRTIVSLTGLTRGRIYQIRDEVASGSV